MEQNQSNTKIAGIDVGKRFLDVAAHGLEDETQVENGPEGHAALIAWLRARRVGRVGLEATGGYERKVRAALEAAGFEVVVHQPLEVRLFARLKRLRAKNDRIDARLIAQATAQAETVRAAQDPRLAELAERLTAYEQVADQIAGLKTFLEHVTLKDVLRSLKVQLASLERLKARLLAQVLQALKAQEDLAARFRLLLSIPGFGPVVAASLAIRMPELGQMRRGQAAALAGVAPFDRDSGQWKGLRFITGGRARVRWMLYLASLAAKRYDPGFKAFHQALLARGKPIKLAIVAVMRKLIEAANLILHRGQPWVKTQPA
ncbi:IS110 family transposase [Phenylobacterium sp.]|uniref:IS110 family transposase n=2 Tax=Phenylobacterium sp. TaxID=1871053 RepID=UPI0025E2865B|nr:IS110 family transposase [Phenylobacterium sp.]MCA6223534.1 IS110 family transposase [Phenylobacterium sp.]MCA6262878.1 IS110 family transposase [Phenylobacterium sp.]MCA6266848.1 IS110 family transposase [Phenylobacterium sp.]MCA6291068.1 IS110 family transposase [Phenylobacterium sp.]